MERDHLSRAIALLEKKDVNGLIGQFRGHNAVGTLLYWFASMTLTSDEYERVKTMMIGDLHANPVNLRFIDRCVLAIVEPGAAGLHPQIVARVHRLYELINRLEAKDKTTIRDWLKVAWERYEGMSASSEQMMDPTLVAERHVTIAIYKLRDGNIDGLVGNVHSINTMGALLYMLASMALLPTEFEHFDVMLLQLAKDSPDRIRWVEMCGLLIVQPEQSTLPVQIQQGVLHLWDHVCDLHAEDKVKIRTGLRATWARYNGET